MALVFVSPPNSYFEMLTPSNDGIRTWGLGGGVLGHEGGALMNGTSTLPGPLHHMRTQ